MPDMPQGGAPAPAPGGAPQGAPAPQGGQPPQGGGDPQSGGGGIAEAIAQVDSTVNAIAQAVAQNPKVPDEVKAAWQDALGALRKAEQALVQAAGGEGGDSEPDEDDQGTTTMEQGGSKGAVPMSHQSMRGK